MKFRSPFVPFESDYFVSKLPSLTVPDQALSIREILDRFSRGLPSAPPLKAIYDEDDTYPDTRSMDLTEIDDLRQSVSEDMADMEAIIRLNSKPPVAASPNTP